MAGDAVKRIETTKSNTRYSSLGKCKDCTRTFAILKNDDGRSKIRVLFFACERKYRDKQ